MPSEGGVALLAVEELVLVGGGDEVRNGLRLPGLDDGSVVNVAEDAVVFARVGLCVSVGDADGEKQRDCEKR